MTFVTFIDPDRGHVTSRDRSLFALSQEPGARDQGFEGEDENL